MCVWVKSYLQLKFGIYDSREVRVFDQMVGLDNNDVRTWGYIDAVQKQAELREKDLIEKYGVTTQELREENL